MRFPLIALTAALLLAGCTSGPDYKGPGTLGAATPSANFVRGGGLVTPESPRLSSWWTQLGDPVLTELQTRALSSNPSLDIARARIGQARESVRQEQANRYPTVAAQGTYVRAELPGVDLGPDNNGSSAGAPPAEGGSDDISSLNFFNLGLNANWELEFAGASRRQIESLNAQLGAAEANAIDAQVQLTAEVGQAYVNLRERQNRIDTLGRARALQEQAVATARQRFQRGTTAAYEVERAQVALRGTEAEVAAAEAERDVYLNALATLTGSAPGSVDGLLAAPAEVPLPPAVVSVGNPAELLQRRPDVRAAERNLAAATARIGVAEALRFPRISFMGILGLGGTKPGDLFDLGNISAIAIPQIQWQLLDFGRNASRVRQARSGLEEAEARYRQAVLGALQDAENSLARFGQQRRQVAALADVRASAERQVRLTRQRFNAGTTARAELLEAERQLTLAEQNLRGATAALTGGYIAVQKSLGLGWAPPVVPARLGN